METSEEEGRLVVTFDDVFPTEIRLVRRDVATQVRLLPPIEVSLKPSSAVRLRRTVPQRPLRRPCPSPGHASPRIVPVPAAAPVDSYSAPATTPIVVWVWLAVLTVATLYQYRHGLG